VLLIGDSVTQGWMECGADFDQAASVEALAARGLNLLMLWAFKGTNADLQRQDGRIGYDAPEIWPWAGSPDTRDVDLLQLNPAYFDRLRQLVAQAESKGIAVLITVHDGWTKTCFAGHPFNRALGNGPLAERHHYVELADYDRELPATFDPAWDWRQRNQYFQERFCARLIAELDGASNVLYEMFNEGEWYDRTQRRQHEQHFLAFFRARCRNLLLSNCDHIAGFDPHSEANLDLVTLHPRDWVGHFPRFAAGFRTAPPRPYLYSEPVPEFDGTTPGPDTLRRSVWETALAGAGWVNQNDASFAWAPRTTIASRAAGRDSAYEVAGHCARFFNQGGVRFWELAPDGRLASTGLCLARPGAEYVVYVPAGSDCALDLAAASGRTLQARWYDPGTGEFHAAAAVAGGARAERFQSPFPGDAVLHLAASPAPVAAGPPGPPARDPEFILRLAALQAGQSHYANGNPGPEANFTVLAEQARQAAGSQADLIVFPEYAISGWPYPDESAINGLAEAVPGEGPWFRRYQALACEVRTPLVGWLVEAEAEKLYNCAFLLDAGGRFVGKYRKVHANLGEQTWWGWSQGDSLQPIEFRGVRYGLSLCSDMWYPETVRCETLLGADVILHLSLADDMGHLVPARACDSFVPIVMSIFQGGCYAVDSRGAALGKLPADGPGWRIFEVKPFVRHLGQKYGGQWDERAGYLNVRNPTAYGALVDPATRPPWTQVFRDGAGEPQTPVDLLRRLGGRGAAAARILDRYLKTTHPAGPAKTDSYDPKVDQEVNAARLARLGILAELRTMPSEAVAAAEQAVFEEARPEQRYEIVTALADTIHTRECAEFLHRVLQDVREPDGQGAALYEELVRRTAVRGLRTMSKRTERSGGKRAPGGPDFPPAVPGLVPYLVPAAGDRAERVRVSALYALADSRDPVAVAELRNRLGDTSEMVRFYAACFLTEYGDAAGLPQMREALTRLRDADARTPHDSEHYLQMEMLLASLERITGKSFGGIPLNPMLVSWDQGEAQRYRELLDAWHAWWTWLPDGRAEGPP
jgi:predicted amidohydrolase